MNDPRKVIAFDVDATGLASLREALPGWQIDTINGATPDSVRLLGVESASLLVVGVRSRAEETWRLCRSLASLVGDRGSDPKDRSVESGAPADVEEPGAGVAPLVLLLATDQESFITAALDSGAQSCLVVPCQPEEIDRILTHAWVGNQSGRHTLNNEQAQRKDRWRDDGGEA